MNEAEENNMNRADLSTQLPSTGSGPELPMPSAIETENNIQLPPSGQEMSFQHAPSSELMTTQAHSTTTNVDPIVNFSETDPQALGTVPTASTASLPSHTAEIAGMNGEPLPTSREMLQSSAQQIVEDLNAKRKQDTQLMADFKETLELHIQKTQSKLEENLFGMYDTQSVVIQEKLQELYATLDSAARMEQELQGFKQATGFFYQDMATTE